MREKITQREVNFAIVRGPVSEDLSLHVASVTSTKLHWILLRGLEA